MAGQAITTASTLMCPHGGSVTGIPGGWTPAERQGESSALYSTNSMPCRKCPGQQYRPFVLVHHALKGGEAAKPLRGTACNSLKEKDEFQVRNWASQRFTRSARHLACKFTRYAHYYPQHLWKTSPRGDAALPRERCGARVGGRFRRVVLDNFNDFYDPAIKRNNLRAQQQNPACKLLVADIRDKAALADIFAQQNFDCVVHLAARAGVRPSLREPLLYVETNINGTMNLLELARAYNDAVAQDLKECAHPEKYLGVAWVFLPDVEESCRELERSVKTLGLKAVKFMGGFSNANLGAEDTVSPYSISWNSTLASNGSHVLTAVARDAAGNTSTSTAVNVTARPNRDGFKLLERSVVLFSTVHAAGLTSAAVQQSAGLRGAAKH
jgi:hypothetical protein